ncbi:MAG TPA: alpha/beta hydrolase [Nocardioidaceae bacterium]|nr:alpha/beta hydrolase [Nocardioidaceae bacterium]
MPVDPHIAPLLELLKSVPPMHEGSPEAAREAFRQLAVGGRRPDQVVPVASVEEVAIPGPAGDIGARVYRPETAGPAPTVVLFHGGGFVIGDLDTHDNMARTICRDCSAVVVSVDYRLAPEAQFPAAVEDAVAATRWAASRLEELGGDERLAVAGDSAGGNLAAVVAQQLRDSGGPALAGQLLVYPATDVTGDYPSRTENAEGYFLDLPTMVWFIQHYAADAAVHQDPRLSPLRHTDLSGLPPAVVVTAEYDPLRDEGEAYARALSEAGVPAEVRRFDGMIHGFFDMGAYSPAAQAAIEESCAMFAKVLSA